MERSHDRTGDPPAALSGQVSAHDLPRHLRRPLDPAQAQGGPLGASLPLDGPALEDAGLLASTDAVEFDSIEEVDAAARSIRRVAVEYGILFVAMMIAVPVLSAVAPWWFARPLWGGLTLNFVAVAVLLHVVFVGVAIAFVRFANHVEDEMLGRREDRGGNADG